MGFLFSGFKVPEFFLILREDWEQVWKYCYSFFCEWLLSLGLCTG